MDMLDKMADIFFDPATAVWSIFAVCGSFFLFFIFMQSNLSLAVFYLALAVLTGVSIAILPTTFKDAAENSIDWQEKTDSVKLLPTWFLGLLGLWITASIIGVLTQGNISIATLAIGAQSLLWVPRNLYPLQTPNVSFKLITDAFATVFAVVPGEESLKTYFTPFYKAYEHVDWMKNLPFAFQPAILAGTSFWAALHIILMQLPFYFFFTALAAGLIMMEMSARAGTCLVGWLIHTSWNLLIIFGVDITIIVTLLGIIAIFSVLYRKYWGPS